MTLFSVRSFVCNNQCLTFFICHTCVSAVRTCACVYKKNHGACNSCSNDSKMEFSPASVFSSAYFNRSSHISSCTSLSLARAMLDMPFYLASMKVLRYALSTNCSTILMLFSRTAFWSFFVSDSSS